MFIDSHAHLEYPDFEGNLEAAISRAKSADVLKIVNIGTTVSNTKKGILLSEKYKGIIFPTAGLHPHDIDEAIDLEKQLQELKKIIQKKKVYAIGECGLDYSRIFESSDSGSDEYEVKKQKELLSAQLLIAKENNLPVVIHSRMAEDDTFEILSNNDFRDLKGVVHCYTGTKEFAEKVLDLGFYIGFTGIITFPKAADLLEVVKEVPLEKILIETDCPFIAPVPYRGQRNEPAYVVEVAKKIADIKNVSLETVAEVTTKNAEELFEI